MTKLANAKVFEGLRRDGERRIDELEPDVASAYLSYFEWLSRMP